MNKFVKVTVVGSVIVVAALVGGYFMSMNMAVDTLKKQFASENAKTFAMVKASVSSVRCEDLFEDKEDQSEILCREQITSTLEAIFKEGVNAEMRANNGAAFFSRENASKMGTVSESLQSLANIQPEVLKAEVTYTDMNEVRETNGKLTIVREPVAIYEALGTIRSELIELFIIIGLSVVVLMAIFNFIFLREPKDPVTVAPVK